MVHELRAITKFLIFIEFWISVQTGAGHGRKIEFWVLVNGYDNWSFNTTCRLILCERIIVIILQWSLWSNKPKMAHNKPKLLQNNFWNTLYVLDTTSKKSKRKSWLKQIQQNVDKYAYVASAHNTYVQVYIK